MSKDRCSSCHDGGIWKTAILLVLVVTLITSAIMLAKFCATSITGDVPEITRALNDKGIATYFKKVMYRSSGDTVKYPLSILRM